MSPRASHIKKRILLIRDPDRGRMGGDNSERETVSESVSIAYGGNKKKSDEHNHHIITGKEEQSVEPQMAKPINCMNML